MKRIKLTIAPLAILPILAAFGCDREVVIENIADNSASACFTCHTDQEFFLVAAQQQWVNSEHASGNKINFNRNEDPSFKSCEGCHTAEGFVERVTGAPAVGDNFSVIGCFTCHAPHTNGDFRVRVTDAVLLLDNTTYDKGASNLCASCHHSLSDVNTFVSNNLTIDSSFGPHNSPQSDMLIGTNGYEYAGFNYVNSAHTNVTVAGCISCHKNGSQANLVGGHTFNMHVDSRGLENTIGCNVPSCHNSELADLDRLAFVDYDADGTTESVQDEIQGLLDSLVVLLTQAGLTDATGAVLTALVPDKDSSGAVFNLKFVEGDRSEGIHNTKYAVGLLQSSINYLNTGNPNGIATRKPTRESITSIQ